MAGSNYHSETVAGARQKLADMVNRVLYRGERIILTRHGRRVAAIVPMNDLFRLHQLDKPNVDQIMKEKGFTIGQAMAYAMEEELKSLNSG